ncbi:MAG: hypothetical protein P9X24_10880 [Candidatus Hatepunaea meridiana]|nr:hypothetical protein [Candidatus Hatepunaea meridiana]
MTDLKAWILKPIIIPILLLVLLMQNLQAEPELLLGDDGVTIWSAPSLNYSGFYSIRDGEAVMLIWSEQDPISKRYSNFLQVMRSDGKTESELPIRLSLPGSLTNKIQSVSDSDGNIFTAWIEEIPNDITGVYLNYRKYNPSGESVWENIPQRREFKRRESLDENHINYRIGGLAHDDRGGMYITFKYGILAIGADGKSRENWNVPKIYNWDKTIKRMIPDHNGGFWYNYTYKARYLGYPEDSPPKIKGFNHFDYNGGRLWEENGWFEGDGPEAKTLEGGKIEMSCFKNGSVILLGRQKKSIVPIVYNESVQVKSDTLYEKGLSIHQIDKNGNYKGRECSHLISFETVYSELKLLKDGRFLILNTTKDSTETALWATVYDPDNNSFPWTKKGRKVANWTVNNEFNKPPSISFNENDWQTNLTQLNNEDIIIPINLDLRKQGGIEWTEVFRLSISGEHVWEQPITLVQRDLVMYAGTNSHSFTGLGSPKVGRRYSVLPGLDNGFWLVSYQYRSGYYGQPYLALYDSSGKSVIEDIRIDGISNGFSAEAVTVWRLRNGNLGILLFHSWQGLRMNELDDRGVKIKSDEKPSIPILAQKALVTSHRLKKMMLLFICPSSLSNYYNYGSPILLAIDMKGDLLWKIELSKEVQVLENKSFQVAVSPDEKHAVVMISMIDQSHYCRLFCIDVSKGKLLWERDIITVPDENDEESRWKYGSDNKTDVLINENEIYGLIFAQKDNVMVIKYDYEGNQIWAKPSSLKMKFEAKLAGARLHESDGIYIIIEEGNWDIVGAIGKHLHSSGAWDEQQFYVHKHSNPDIETLPEHFRASPFRSFTIVNTGKNMWVVPQQLGEFGVQCITFPWNRQMGNYGFIPENSDIGFGNRRYQYSRFLSDNKHGLWTIWGKEMEIIHFDSKGGICNGWTDEGLQAFAELEKFTKYWGFALSNGDVAVIASDRDGRLLKLQRISDGE